jgi:hypothetical protein
LRRAAVEEGTEGDRQVKRGLSRGAFEDGKEERQLRRGLTRGAGEEGTEESGS